MTSVSAYYWVLIQKFDGIWSKKLEEIVNQILPMLVFMPVIMLMTVPMMMPVMMPVLKKMKVPWKNLQNFRI